MHCLGWVANGISAQGLEMVVVAPNLVCVPLDRGLGEGTGGHPQEQDPSWWTQHHACWPLSCPSTGDTPCLGLFRHVSGRRGAPCCWHHRPGTSLRFPWGHKLPQRGAAKRAASWDPAQGWMAPRVQPVFASYVNKPRFFISVEINAHPKLPNAKASTGELIGTLINLLRL